MQCPRFTIIIRRMNSNLVSITLPVQSTLGFWPIRKRVETQSFYKILKVAAENHIGRSYSDSVIKTIIGSKFPLLMLLYCLFVFTFSILVDNVFILYLIWEAGLPPSGSTCLPPMRPRFNFRTRRHTWIKFVGSLLCSERLFPSYIFPLSSKTSIWLDLINCIIVIWEMLISCRIIKRIWSHIHANLRYRNIKHYYYYTYVYLFITYYVWILVW